MLGDRRPLRERAEHAEAAVVAPIGVITEPAVGKGAVHCVRAPSRTDSSGLSRSIGTPRNSARSCTPRGHRASPASRPGRPTRRSRHLRDLRRSSPTDQDAVDQVQVGVAESGSDELEVRLLRSRARQRPRCATRIQCRPLRRPLRVFSFRQFLHAAHCGLAAIKLRILLATLRGSAESVTDIAGRSPEQDRTARIGRSDPGDVPGNGEAGHNSRTGPQARGRSSPRPGVRAPRCEPALSEPAIGRSRRVQDGDQILVLRAS